MSKGGTLLVRTEAIQDKLQIIIRDTGCGIPLEHMSSIEEPFFTTNLTGNGLGFVDWPVDHLECRRSNENRKPARRRTQIRIALPALSETADKTA